MPQDAYPFAARRRLLRRRQVERMAWEQQGIVSRRQVYAAGFTRWEVKANCRAGRWRKVGRQTICVHTGPLTLAARHWVAVFEAGPRAYLDAGSSLQEAGLRQFEVERVRVSVPRGARIWRAQGYDIRQTRRWNADDLADERLPRSRNAVAAVRAALWARSDRQAALALTMVVQQGLATAEELGVAMLAVRRDRRRAFLYAVVLDLMGGVQSLGELDVAVECRRRGLPEPDRQVARRGRGGSYYLDVLWARWGVALEVDGIHHTWAENVVGDALRHNEIAMERTVVLRLPLLGLRLQPDAFYEQIEQALRRAGWPGRDRRTA